MFSYIFAWVMFHMSVSYAMWHVPWVMLAHLQSALGGTHGYSGTQAAAGIQAQRPNTHASSNGESKYLRAILEIRHGNGSIHTTGDEEPGDGM